MPRATRNDGFAPGTRVKHPAFAGVGTVMNSPANNDYATMVSWTGGTALCATASLREVIPVCERCKDTRRDMDEGYVCRDGGRTVYVDAA